jgi:hypothetical protein
VGAIGARVAHELALNAIHVFGEPVTSNGLLELRASLREVTLSLDHHRYGMPGRATPISRWTR